MLKLTFSSCCGVFPAAALLSALMFVGVAASSSAPVLFAKMFLVLLDEAKNHFVEQHLLLL